MSDTPAKPRRRWLSFSLRGMFVAVTLLGCWLGWQVRIVRERQAVRQWLVSRGDELRINPLDNPFYWRRPWMCNREHLNFIRASIRDDPVDQVRLNSPISKSEMERVARAFPYSIIDGWTEPTD